MSTTPKFVLSAGMVGSASTFIYNVARELLIHDLPSPAPLAIYSDVWDPKFVAPRSLIVKCHGGSPSLLAAAKDGLIKPFVTIRHPGDSVCSDMERFGLSFVMALARVELSLGFSLSLSALPTTTMFRYEDRFMSNAGTPAAIARLLGIEADAKTLSLIYAKYNADGTRRLAEQVDTQPESLSNADNGDVWCPTTQIHRRHIGAMISGRWTSLSPAQLRIVAERCGDAAGSLGYSFDR